MDKKYTPREEALRRVENLKRDAQRGFLDLPGLSTYRQRILNDAEFLRNYIETLNEGK